MCAFHMGTIDILNSAKLYMLFKFQINPTRLLFIPGAIYALNIIIIYEYTRGKHKSEHNKIL